MNTPLSNDQLVSVWRRERLRTTAATGVGALLTAGRELLRPLPDALTCITIFNPMWARTRG